MGNNYKIRSIERALSLLKCFNVDNTEIGLSQFVELTGLSKSTAFRILDNLKCEGFLDINSEGKYIIGNEILRLANISYNSEFLRKGTYKLLDMAASISGETAILVKYNNYKAICIEKIESDKSLKITSEIGKIIPLFRGASGKSIAAFLDDYELAQCLQFQKNMSNMQYDLDKLKEEFEVIRKDGYCVTKSEVDEGVAALGVPILGGGGKVLGSISIAGPDFRFNDKVINSIQSKIIEQVNALSRKMGYIS